MPIDIYLNTRNWHDCWEENVSSGPSGLDDEFGEDFIISTMIDRPNYKPAIDNHAPAYTCRAVFSNRYYTGLNISGKDGANAIGVESSRPYIDVAVKNLRRPVKQSDQFCRIRTGAIYAVYKIVPDGTGVRCGFWVRQLGEEEGNT